MKMTAIRASMALVALGALSACGGGGGASVGADVSANFGSNYASFAEMEARGEVLGDRYENADLTPIEDMPTSGKATYTGLAAFGAGDFMYLDDEDITVASEARMTANFGRGVVDGELTNFQANDGTRITGGARITEGMIVDNEFIAKVDGNISSKVQSGRLDGIVAGGFVGSNAQAAMGVFDVDLIEANGATTTYGGAMLVERD